MLPRPVLTDDGPAVDVPGLKRVCQPPRLGDVAQLRRDGTHAMPAIGDFGHDLRRATLDRSVDPLPQNLGTLPKGSFGQYRATPSQCQGAGMGLREHGAAARLDPW